MRGCTAADVVGCGSRLTVQRIDNAHSTPLSVAAAIIDAAREERPELYVVAELFSGPEMEVLYTSTLGINALIREAMQVGGVTNWV